LDPDPVGAFFNGTSTKLFKTDLALAVAARSVWMTREEVTKDEGNTKGGKVMEKLGRPLPLAIQENFLGRMWKN